MEWAILPLLPSRSASPHFGQYSFPVPKRVGGWVSLGGWLHTEVACPPEEGHRSRFCTAAELKLHQLVCTSDYKLFCCVLCCKYFKHNEYVVKHFKTSFKKLRCSRPFQFESFWSEVALTSVWNCEAVRTFAMNVQEFPCGKWVATPSYHTYGLQTFCCFLCCEYVKCKCNIVRHERCYNCI